MYINLKDRGEFIDMKNVCAYLGINDASLKFSLMTKSRKERNLTPMLLYRILVCGTLCLGDGTNISPRYPGENFLYLMAVWRS